MSFLSVQGYVIGIIIAVVAVQYAFALFCLLKLAYMDFEKKLYILWNLFILIVFFIGGTVFLVYYCKHPEKRIKDNAGATQEQPSEQPSEKPEEPEQNKAKEEKEQSEE